MTTLSGEYRTPEEAAEKKKPWICARVETALTGRYFRHMFSQGRVIIPWGGWYERTVEGGKKQPWYISRRTGEPILMAGITNWRPYTARAQPFVANNARGTLCEVSRHEQVAELAAAAGRRTREIYGVRLD